MESRSTIELVSRAEGKARETQEFVYQSSESPTHDSYVSIEKAWFAHKANSKSGLFQPLSPVH
jgi:hypothetical protein